MDKITLYTLSTCPKCKVLKMKCSNSDKIQNSDYHVVNLDEDIEALNKLQEMGIKSAPILQVNDHYYTFHDAIEYLKS